MTRSFFKDRVTFEDMWPPRSSELSHTVCFVCVCVCVCVRAWSGNSLRTMFRNKPRCKRTLQVKSGTMTARHRLTTDSLIQMRLPEYCGTRCDLSTVSMNPDIQPINIILFFFTTSWSIAISVCCSAWIRRWTVRIYWALQTYINEYKHDEQISELSCNILGYDAV